VKVFFVRLILHLLAVMDTAWFWARARKAARAKTATTAGAGIQAGQRVTTVSIGTVIWPEFPSLAHSFWRAQELTLFREHTRFFSEPILDLGCGDSLFGQLAGFPRNGFGVDYDAASLAAARELGSSLKLIQGDAGNLPLADACVAACLSNSVLEHLPDLDRCFSEVHRVLKPNGVFLFSMTLGSFTSQLKFWAGQRDADRWVRTFGHFQQLSHDELLRKLAAHGFTISTCISYQSRWTTAWYRFMVSPCFQFVERRGGNSFRRCMQTRLASKVSESLRYTRPGEGACLFVVSIKNPA
jgi:SAM-dependent methyltransferase